MKWILLLVAAILRDAICEPVNRQKPSSTSFLQAFIDREYRNYLVGFQKSVPLAQRHDRYQQFVQSKSVIEEHNAKFQTGEVKYQMGLNPFSDWMPTELQNLVGLTLPATIKGNLVTNATESKQALPARVDLRSSSCMPPIKNQGNCGACWAFSANTPVEYQLCMRNGNNVRISLSEQQLIDCSGSAYGNHGCSGGFYTNAWDYVPLAIGQTTSVRYPYRGRVGACYYSNSMRIVNVPSYVRVTPGSDTELMRAVANYGPISVAVYANQNFQNYRSGLYDDPTCNQPVNHGVVVVGYGTLGGIPCWVVRNSWGPFWGVNGYIFMRRGANQCGITLWPYYPIIQ